MNGCTSPLYRIPIGSRSFVALLPMDQNRLKNHGVFLKRDQLDSYKGMPGFYDDEVQILRCGQCIDCRLNYSRDWAVRCALEAQQHQYNYFVTLTYDDYTVPRGEFLDSNGDVYDTTLVRRDIQLFIKSLREWESRENGNTGIKVFYCGEYGDLTSRPHFHLIIFGASPISDLLFHRREKRFNFYKSLTYESFWNTRINGVKVLRGFVDISEASFDTMAYVSRYCTKKIKGVVKSDFLEFYYGLDPGLRLPLRSEPFIGMSLKPGIAAEYFAEHKDQIYLEDKVKYQKKYRLFKSKPPRYFDKLFDREDPAAFAKVKKKRLDAAVGSRKYRLSTQISETEQQRLLHEDQINIRKEKRVHVRGL